MNTNEHHPAIEPGTIVAGITLQSALNAKRVRVMMRRKNGLFTDAPERDGLVGMESLFYCLSLTSDDLSAKFSLKLDEWDEECTQFAEGLPDGGLEAFGALFADENEVIAGASVEPIEEGKAERATTEGPSPVGSQASSPRPQLTALPTISQRNSPSSESCSTSTLPDTPTEENLNGRTAAPRTVAAD